MTTPAQADPVRTYPDFEDYVTAQSAALLRHASVVSADPQRAPDIVQAVLERAFTRWDHIRTLDHPDAYVRRMVVNETISTHRRKAWLVLSGRELEPPPVADHAGRVDDRDLLIAQLRKLPARQRAAVALRYFYDFTDAQIATELDCGESTVRGYIFRALRTLRLELTDEH